MLSIGYTRSAASAEERVRELPLFRGDSLILPAFQNGGRPPPGLDGQY